MKPLILSRGRAWLLEGLAWLAFYLTVHFSLNDEQYSFWLPFKFIVAVPQTLFTMAAVYGFGRLFARPLDAPVGRLLLYAAGVFVLLHVVYYYALHAAQPYAPQQSVAYRRWTFFMASRGPFYFLFNFHYLLTVSSFFYFSQFCLPLGVKLLHDSFRESQRLAAAQRQQLAWELAAVRTRLNPAFFQQTLGQIGHLLDQQQTPTAAEATLKLAQVLRHTLYENRAAYAPLARELDAYLDYVQLQELRLQERVDITLRLTVESAKAYTVLAGVLLPLTEQYLTLAATAAEVELRVQGTQLTLWLRADCAPGRPAPDVAAVATRLAHYAGPDYQLVLQHQAGESTLTLHLPLRPAAHPQPASQPPLSFV